MATRRNRNFYDGDYSAFYWMEDIFLMAKKKVKKRKKKLKNPCTLCRKKEGFYGTFQQWCWDCYTEMSDLYGDVEY